MVDLPLGLRHALEGGNCVLFVGAGVGGHLRRTDNTTAPDGFELAKEMAAHFGIDSDGHYDLAQISQVVELRKGRKDLDTYVRTKLSELEPDDTFQWLFSRRWKAIYTTNYDHSIERSYELNANPCQTPVTLSVTQDVVPVEPRFQVPVIHLHGVLFGTEAPRIVITENDYLRFRERRKMLFELLKLHAATSTFLYIGYSNRDPNWKLVLDELTDEFRLSQMPHSYRLAPTTPVLEAELLKSKAIDTITGDLTDFVQAASAVLATDAVDNDSLTRAQKLVPSELSHAFDANAPATMRLLSSWTYVNQAPFSERPNLRAFLRGDRPNWALIAARDFFIRDLEEPLYNDALDFATSSNAKPAIDVLLGPAGFGVTTLLLSIAAQLVQERAGVVFCLRPGAELLEGDIEYATTIAPDKRTFFFIDNAAHHRRALDSAVRRLRTLQRPAMFIVGSRLNEWRQAGLSALGNEYELQDLSDPEIERLIAYLDKHDELGQLAPLSAALRTAAIRSKHGKQLLVAMREATEGPGFDAIIEDEFRNIQGDLAQKAYLAVCAFYQHGVYLRDGLLANCLEVDLEKMHSEIGSQTDGVIMYDLLNEYYGVYGARARHRTIAEIVWLRCGGENRERLLQDALKHMNLNFGSDNAAFEQLVRSDVMVDAIGTLDGKIRYFDTACRKDPDSPYVLQHYARMLSREGRWELALSQIDAAIKLKPTIRVLYHTKGKILAGMTTATESEDMARKRMVQAESAFQHGLKMAASDEYCLQGLAELYLDWAKRASTPHESTEYIAKSEEVITEGLRVVRSREALRIVSAQIAGWLGQQPAHLKALETAVQEAPNSIVARYLLGRTYRRGGDPEKARQVLEPLVQEHPEEVRACVELARSVVESGEPFDKAIAVLRLSTLRGFSDPRFIATLGGMLFLNGQFTEADEVFAKSVTLGLAPSELYRSEYKPRDRSDPNKPLRLKGTVAAVKNGYAFFDVQGYPRVFSPGAKWYGTPMRRGMNVEFDIVFAPKGAQADKPTEAGESS